MAKFNLGVSDSALKELRDLDKQLTERIMVALNELEDDPFKARPKADIKKLKGFRNPDMFRLRVGDYRIVYTVLRNEVKITHILKRSTIYKGLD